MAKRTIVQRLDTDTGVIGPAESLSACIEEFNSTGSAVSVGSFVSVNTLTRRVQKAQANNSTTLAYGIVTKLLSNTRCEVMTSGITTLTKSGVSAGAILYLSSGTAGESTIELTDVDGNFLQPVAKVLSVNSGVCTIELLLTGVPAPDLSNLLKLDRFMYAVNSHDGRLVLGDNDDTLTPSAVVSTGDPVTSTPPYKLEVQGAAKAGTLDVAGMFRVTGDSYFTGAISAADSATVEGLLTAESGISVVDSTLAVSGYINLTNPSVPSALPGLDGMLFAESKIACGDSAGTPNAYIEGSTGDIYCHAIDTTSSIDCGTTLTANKIIVEGTSASSISTNGGLTANGEISCGGLIVTENDGSNDATLELIRYDSSIGALDNLATVHFKGRRTPGVGELTGAYIQAQSRDTSWGADPSSIATDLNFYSSVGADPKLFLSLTTKSSVPTVVVGTDSTEVNVFVTGDLVADSVTPFTGQHLYPAVLALPVGSAVILDNGVVSLSSSPRAKNCVGVFSGYLDSDIDSLNTGITGTKARVAAVGDCRTKDLLGFLVCNENGPVEAGDLLCTSSTPGYLMKQDDDIIRAYTVGKALETPVFDADGKASGVYGFLYCG